MSPSDLQWMYTYTALWEEYTAAGQHDLARQAHEMAEAIRAGYNYSGGSDGNTYTPYPYYPPYNDPGHGGGGGGNETGVTDPSTGGGNQPTDGNFTDEDETFGSFSTGGWRYVRVDGASVHVSPGSRSILFELNIGTEVYFTGKDDIRGKERWVEVRLGPYTGWIIANNLTNVRPSNPIRVVDITNPNGLPDIGFSINNTTYKDSYGRNRIEVGTIVYTGNGPYVYLGDYSVRYTLDIHVNPSVMEAAYMAQHIYAQYDGVNYPLLGGWKQVDIIYGRETMVMGIYSRMINGITSYALVYKGTLIDFFGEYADRTEAEWIQNLKGPFGISEDYEDAIAEGEAFVRKNPNAHITFIGHSKGGGEALAAAVATNKNAIVFNPMAPNLVAYGLNAAQWRYSASATAYIVDWEILKILNYFGVSMPSLVKQVPLDRQSLNPFTNHSMESVISALR